jgi:serine-type D-Ala-D-Ala carboxypeptidase/endopeptidase
MTAADALDFTAVDALAATFQRRGGQPALVYGIVAGGRLAHSRGLGHRWLGGPAPDAGTVFRIASMTKSFTAAAVLLLRDEGAITLDDPAENYVPELRALRPASPDAPRLSVRHLLTMTAGFPTDDPWGDRQQGLPLPEFSRLLADGLSFTWAPGTRFEYSNLGYAILGRVITGASGVAYPDFVRDRLLRPLRLARTGYAAQEFDQVRLARGHRRGDGGWEELVPDPDGAFAPMGGIFSCVSDLARWVSGFAAAFPPAEADAGGAHPLARATRREMQSPQVALTSPVLARLPGDPSGAGPAGYGFGLFTEDHPVWGPIISHSGGYPGFGSHMRWHVATGTGVIVLANSTYAAASPLAARLLEAVLPQVWATGPQAPPPVRGPAPAPGGPWPRTLHLQREVSRLLRAWDDATADSLFSANVAQDEPYVERRRTLDLIRRRLGDFADDPARPAEFDSPAHCRWWLRGEGGAAAAEIRLTPERNPRVQSLALAVPPAPDSPLALVLASVVSLLNGHAPGWPPALPVSPVVDTSLLLRQLRMAAAWAGPCRVGSFRAGNGETAATVELDGEHARLTLAVTVDPAGHLHHAEILLGP